MSGHGSGIVIGTGKDTEFGVVFEMMQDVGLYTMRLNGSILIWQVEEQRTPLQLAMDDLAKRLSFFSFGVIGVIFLIGVLQHRGWLEMFTIGGTSFQLFIRYTLMTSVTRCCCHSRGIAYCYHRHPRSRCFENV